MSISSRIDRFFLLVHVACTLLALAIVGFFCLNPSRTTNYNEFRATMTAGMAIVSGSAFLIGLALMLRRSGPSESVGLAISTLMAFFLLILSQLSI